MTAAQRRSRLGPRRRNTLTEKVGMAIRERIASGEYSVGEKLPKEQDLVARFAVSRTVIREALAQLSADGLVDIRHGVGVFVLEPPGGDNPFLAKDLESTSAVLDLFELRRGVETEAAGLAAMRRSPAQEANIRDAYRRLKEASERGEPAPELDLELHRAIARATNNRCFLEFLEFLAERVFARAIDAGYCSDQALKLDKIDHLQDEHRKIVEAISLQDSQLAREAMREHLVASENRFRALTMKQL